MDADGAPAARPSSEPRGARSPRAAGDGRLRPGGPDVPSRNGSGLSDAAWVWTDEVLADAARLLRTWHEASVDFDETDAIWQSPRHEPVEVIGHNDFSPHNMVFDDGRLIGVIDVDMCSPGCRVWDLAYVATRLVPLTAGGGDGTADGDELRRRLALLTDAYGPFEGDLLATAHVRLLDLADFSEVKAVELDKPHLRDEAVYYRAEAAWLEATLLDPPR